MDLDAQLRESLGQDYEIERELEPGGMARVFVAKEVALGRRVVIKVLPPEMASVVLSERFRRGSQTRRPRTTRAPTPRSQRSLRALLQILRSRSQRALSFSI